MKHTGWIIGVSYDKEWQWPVFRIRDMHNSNDRAEVESARKLMEAAPALLTACQKLTNIAEVVGHCVGKWTTEHQALAQEYAAEGREAIFKAEQALTENQ